MLENNLKKNRPIGAYLVGIQRSDFGRREAQEHLDELEQLVDTMKMPVLGKEMVVLRKPTPQFLLGQGKMEEIKAAAEMCGAQLIIIDDELAPPQQHNWEAKTKLAVIDRREVILDIFAQRARTKEARLQVELAQLEYSLPRLKRAWTHLERQRGGGGFVGGAGEAQIEVDRRLVRDQIAKHKRDLEAVRRQRASQRKARQAKPVPSAAIVGYTNSGKSSMLNALTGADVLAEDKLFATLDPTTRKIRLKNNQTILLTDTVGFIRKLPTMLVEAFKATLEEAMVADFLVHVVDASHPTALDHIAATNQVLEELGALDKPMFYVLNKMDLVEDGLQIAALRAEAQPYVETSVLHKWGLDTLAAKLAEMANRGHGAHTLRIPPDRQDIVSLIHREGRILEKTYDDEVAVITVEIADKYGADLEPFGWTPATTQVEEPGRV